MTPVQGRAAGFSLLEVLMALIVAAVLSSTLLGVQRQSMALTEINLGAWDSLNLAHEILMARPPKEILNPTPDWVEWAPVPGSRMRLFRERFPGSEYAELFTLETQVSGQSAVWYWHHLQPLPKLSKEKPKNAPAK